MQLLGRFYLLAPSLLAPLCCWEPWLVTKVVGFAAAQPRLLQALWSAYAPFQHQPCSLHVLESDVSERCCPAQVDEAPGSRADGGDAGAHWPLERELARQLLPVRPPLAGSGSRSPAAWQSWAATSSACLGRVKPRV